MNSWATITSVGGDLEAYLDDNYTGDVPYITEHDPDTIENLIKRKDIPGLRLCLYEQPEEVLSRVQRNSAYDMNQAYQLQLFFVVARIGDYDTLVEKELLTFKDHIKEWAFDIDAGDVTSNELLTFEWDAISRLERRNEYSLMEINFGAFRQTRL